MITFYASILQTTQVWPIFVDSADDISEDSEIGKDLDKTKTIVRPFSGKFTSCKNHEWSIYTFEKPKQNYRGFIVLTEDLRSIIYD